MGSGDCQSIVIMHFPVSGHAVIRGKGTRSTHLCRFQHEAWAKMNWKVNRTKRARNKMLNQPSNALGTYLVFKTYLLMDKLIGLILKQN